jgi:hypothetical protein
MLKAGLPGKKMYHFEQQYVLLYEKMLWSHEGLSQSEQFASATRDCSFLLSTNHSSERSFGDAIISPEIIYVRYPVAIRHR